MAVSAGGAAPGAWQDYVTLAGIWVFVKFGSSHWLWPFPNARLAYVMTVLVAVNVALAAFVLVRRLKGIGYSIGWGKSWGFYVLGASWRSAASRFHWARGCTSSRSRRSGGRWSGLLFSSLANLGVHGVAGGVIVSRAAAESAGRGIPRRKGGMVDGVAALRFLAHHEHGFPNWRYAALATIAGIFLWLDVAKERLDFASTLVHAAVDVTWHLLFRTG